MTGYGAFFPFYGLYLRQDLGLSGTQVGVVLAVLPAVGLFTQAAWGHVADRSGARQRVLAVLAAGMGMCLLLIPLWRSFAGTLFGTALLAVFVTSVMPQATAVSLATQAADSVGVFGRVRMWGTLGFLVQVVSFPYLLARLEQGGGPWAELWSRLPWSGLALLFPVAAAASLGAAAVALRLPSAAGLRLAAARGDGRRLLRHPPVVRLLAVVFVAHLCLQGPINLFPLYVASRGGDAGTLSRMWIFMLLLEIPLIGFSGATLRRLGPRGLLALGLVAEGVRWTTCALTTDLAVVRAVQLLHGVGVAGVIVGGPLYLELAVPERLRSTGQAWISTVAFGASSILSTTLGGWLFDRIGSSAPYAVCGAGALTLSLLLYKVLPEPWRPDEVPAAAPAG